MANVTVTAARVSPLPGALIEEYVAGASGNVGDTVYMASTGRVSPANGAVAGTAYAIGVVISVGGGKTTFASGDTLGIVTVGRVAGFGGLTPGEPLYQSDTAGRLGDANTDGTVVHQVAEARTATIVFVNPAHVAYPSGGGG